MRKNGKFGLAEFQRGSPAARKMAAKAMRRGERRPIRKDKEQELPAGSSQARRGEWAGADNT